MKENTKNLVGIGTLAAILAAYDIVPTFLIPLISLIIVACELAVAVGLFLNNLVTLAAMIGGAFGALRYSNRRKPY